MADDEADARARRVASWRVQQDRPITELLASESLGQLGALMAVDADGCCAASSPSSRCAARCGQPSCVDRGPEAHAHRSRSFILPSVPSHDVLIIGAGLAGQRAALAAAQTGATVAIISKVHPVRSHSVAAAGGINAALNPEDTWESHAFDTIKGSDYLGDQDAIEIMSREAPAEILWLEHAGVTFHRNETGNLGTRAFGGASAARTYYVADITGHAILHVLYEQLMKHSTPSTATRSGSAPTCCRTTTAAASARSAATCVTASLQVFNAKNMILANGGAGQAYKPTTNGLIVTGDGIAQAYRIGARLMDMEMIQYHPTTLAGNGLLITEGARGEGAWLLNAKGERFMEKYAPNKLELASRDVVSRAEQTEINEGSGFPDGTVALDITKVPRRRMLEALREIVNIGRDFAGVDITREPIHIHPGQHYIMGGVKTDVDGQTTIPGLYAAGEVACVSVHGGNRLGANSLLDTLIFGRRSGEHAAAQALQMPMPTTPATRVTDTDRAISAIINRSEGGRRVVGDQGRARRDDEPVRGRVPRRRGAADKAHEIIRRLKEEAPKAVIDDRGTVFNQDVIGAIELGYMLDCRRGHRRRRDRAQGVPRSPVPHRLPGAQRRRVAQAHRHHGQRRRRAHGQLLTGDDHQVGTPGKDLLSARVSAEDPPLRPQVRRGRVLG